MKYSLSLCSMAFSGAVILSACTGKSNNYSSGPDHTIGMTDTRVWHVHSKGVAKGDTVILDTALRPIGTKEWPKKFDRRFDTSMSLARVDDFTIRAMGLQFNYRKADANTVYYDTVFAGTGELSILNFYSVTDSIICIYQKRNGVHASTGIAYVSYDTMYSKK